MSLCTWIDCRNEATHPQIGKGAQQWANLCGEHHKQLDDSFGNLREMLSCWVKAQGGATAMTARMSATDALASSADPAPWVVKDGDSFVCKRCGLRFDPKLPMDMKVYIAVGRAFVRLHSLCGETKQ